MFLVTFWCYLDFIVLINIGFEAMKKLLLSIACVLLVSLSLLPFATSAVASPQSQAVAELCMRDGGMVKLEDDFIVVCEGFGDNHGAMFQFIDDCYNNGGQGNPDPRGLAVCYLR